MFRYRRLTVCGGVFVFALSVGYGIGEAQAPKITAVSPGAVQPGTTLSLTVRGSNLAGVKQLWMSFPAKAVLAPGVKNNGKNAAQAVFRVTVPSTVSVGIYGLRVVTEKGVSPLRLIVVDDLPTVAAKGNNTSPSLAQSIPSLTGVEGAVPPLGRHYYRFTAAAGQRLSFEVLARRIGSPLDPLVKLFAETPHGLVELDYADDTPGLFGDAQFSHHFAEAGRYVLEVRDIRFQGGGNYRYRLRVGDFPCVTVPYPLGVQRGKTATLSFGGLDIAGLQPTVVKVPQKESRAWLSVGAKRKGGKSSGIATLAVSDAPQAVEREPNDDRKKATRVQAGVHLNGRFQKPRDVDRYVFSAKKGQQFVFRAVTRQQGAPSDLLLRLEDAKGRQLAQSDDVGLEDGLINYRIPADGDYQLVVEELLQRGGTPYVYRIEVREAGAVPFALSANADHVNIPAGGTAAVTVDVTRRGYNGAIHLSAEGLPAGISAVPTVIGPGRGSVVLTLVGTKKAKRGTAVPVRIVGTAVIGKKKVQSVCDIEEALKTLTANYPYPPPALQHAFVAAAAPPAPFSLQPVPQSVTVKRGKKVTVKIQLQRGKDITEAVTLALPPVPRRNPKKAGLPTGLAVAVKPIPKGKQEVTLTISANSKVPKGEYSATLLATHKKGKVTVQQNVPGILIKVE